MFGTGTQLVFGPDMTTSKSLLERFFDAFLQERNIQWLLGIGLATLLGSSLMLVTANWSRMSGVWQLFVCLGYTGAVFEIGRWCRDRLALPKTGTGLYAVTVFLLPLCFVLWARTMGNQPFTWLMVPTLGAVLGLCLVAARRIFTTFLRDLDRGYLASYVGLSAAGALLWWQPLPIPAPAAALGLWLVLCFGVRRVADQVFCLVERKQKPKVFGFLPIALLGIVFLVHYCRLVPAMPPELVGLGLTLLAVPVLDTAYAMLRAQRGPRAGIGVALLTPLAVGIVLLVSGCVLAGSGLLAGGGHALVPAAAITAVQLGLLARRFGSRTLVWIGLVALTVAYQFSPVFFRETVVAWLKSGAALVHEKRMPLAFYGLTYLPLLTVLAWCARIFERRGISVFVGPMRAFGFLVSVLLLGLSWTHAKAVFPVSIAIAGLATFEMLLDRDRRRLFLIAPALASAAFGFPGFVGGVLGWSAPAVTTCLAVLAFAFVLVSKPVEAGLSRLPVRGPRVLDRPLHAVGVAAAVLLVGLWSVEVAARPTQDCLATGLVAGLLLVQGLRYRSNTSTAIGVVVLSAGWVLEALHAGMAVPTLVSLVTLEVVVLRSASWLLSKRPELVISQSAARATRWLADPALFALLCAWHLPRCLVAPSPVGWLELVTRTIIVVASTISTVALANERRATGPVAHVVVLALLGVFTMFVSGTHVAIAAAVAGLTGLFVHGRCGRAFRLPVRNVSFIALAGISVVSLGVFDVPMLIAGLLAVAGLLWFGGRLDRMPRYLVFAVATVKLVALPLCWSGAATLLELDEVLVPPLFPQFALLAAAASVVWARVSASESDPELAELGTVLKLTAILVADTCLILSLGARPLPVLAVLAGVPVFAMHAIRALGAAFRQDDEAYAWLGLASVAAGFGYLLLHGVVTVGAGTWMFVALGVAVGFGLGARLVPERYAIVRAPLATTSRWLPAVTVLLAMLVRGRLHGFESLALLGAAAMWFHTGIKTRLVRWHVAAGATVDLAVALLWHELAWTDPQLFLIPIGLTIIALVTLCKERLPEKSRNPLRYLGALVILVSPVFEIAAGSWAHMFSLMVAAIFVGLLGIGLRVRALLYTGAAFLAADLVAMVVRGSIDRPNLLWIVGLVAGTGVLVIAAIAEHRRERLLQRVRIVSASLRRWE